MEARLTSKKELNLNYFKIPIEDFDINNEKGKAKEIRNLLLNTNHLTFDEYRKIDQTLKEYIEQNQVELIEIFLSEEIETQDATFKINKNTKTASLFKIIKETENFILPKSVQYNSENYTVTSIIDSGSGYNKLVKNFQFDEDTKIQTIYRKAFYKSSIESLYIPPNLKDLQEGWCIGTNNLNCIKISPLNKNFQFINDQFLLGKSDPKSDNFDVLLFAVRNISEAKIPSNIKIISSYSFYGCENLTKIEIPQNSELQRIENNAFSYTQIEHIFIPPHLNNLNGIFRLGSQSLKKFEISKLNKNFLFKNDQFLLGKSDPKSDNFDVLLFAVRDISEAKIPSNIKVISSFAFTECEQLTKVEIPLNSKLQKIEEYAFANTPINQIFIPQHVKMIGCHAFEQCEELEIVEFAQNSELQIIDEYAFSNTQIYEIFIPSNVSKLGRNAFSGCLNLDYVEIPKDSKLQSFEKWTFANTKINQIFVPCNVKKICDCAFSRCLKLVNIGIPKNSKLESIGTNAFSYTQIEEIYFPSKLKELSEGWCSNLEILDKIRISPLNKNFKIIDDQILLEKSDPKSDNFDVLLFSVRNISEVKIPSNIKIISSNAFCNCQYLTSIEIPPDSKLKIIGRQAFSNTIIEKIFIPPNVTKIGEYAFDSCENLSIIEIPKNSELKIIGRQAFFGTKIEKIFIPPNVTKIGEYAFDSCENLSIIEIPKNLELQIIEQNSFAGTKINKINIPYHTKIISENAFHSCENLEIVEFPINSELRYIGRFAFNNTKIKKISIPFHVLDIFENAFNLCENLEYIEIPENSELQSIGKYAFNETKIEKIYIPSKLVNLETGWWFGAYYLRKILISPLNKNFEFKNDQFFLGKTNPKGDNFDVLLFAVPNIVKTNVPSNIKIISTSAFSDCNDLITVDFPANSELQSIEKNAFTYSKIKQMLIPSHVSNIDDDAFSFCDYIQIFQIEENSELKSINENIFSFSRSSLIIMIPSNNS